METENCFSPINSIVVNINGDFLGYVSDIELGSKYEILNINVGKNTTINLCDVVNVTDSAIITCIGKKKPKISSFKEKQTIPTTLNNIKVNALNSKQIETILPARSITNYNFLINRKVNRDILNFNGEIIITSEDRKISEESFRKINKRTRRSYEWIKKSCNTR